MSNRLIRLLFVLWKWNGLMEVIFRFSPKNFSAWQSIRSDYADDLVLLIQLSPALKMFTPIILIWPSSLDFRILFAFTEYQVEVGIDIQLGQVDLSTRLFPTHDVLYFQEQTVWEFWWGKTCIAILVTQFFYFLITLIYYTINKSHLPD